MDKICIRILNRLLDKYESSKSFVGANQVNQSFSVLIGKEFPKYKDDADFHTFSLVNEAVHYLEQQDFVAVKKQKNSVVTSVRLNSEKLDEIYSRLRRTPKRDHLAWLEKIWNEQIYQHSDVLPMMEYIKVQTRRAIENKNVEYFDGRKEEYRDILKAVAFMAKNEQESFLRDVSIHLFGDSKRLEQIRGKVQGLLFQYGDFEERDSVLEECAVVKTPTYVMMKGNGVIHFEDQLLDLSRQSGDIAVSTKTLEEISRIEVKAKRVVTIENMTSFHDYQRKDDFCIYLGGFHNKIKRKMLGKLHKENEVQEYRHFGDIDAGGFYIYEHLIERTEIAFETLHMNCTVLCSNQKAWKPLTENDRKRLRALKAKVETRLENRSRGSDYREVIDFMLENNCKMEQEAIGEIK